MALRLHDVLGLPRRDVDDLFLWRRSHLLHDEMRDTDIDRELDVLRRHPWDVNKQHGRSMYMVTSDGTPIGGIAFTRVDWYDTAPYWHNPEHVDKRREMLRIIHERVVRYGLDIWVHTHPRSPYVHDLRTFPYAIEEVSNASGMPMLRFRVVRERTDLLPFMQE